MLNYVKRRVREHLHGKVTIGGGDQEGHDDGGDGVFRPLRSRLTLREASKPSTAVSIIWPTYGSGLRWITDCRSASTHCVSHGSLSSLVPSSACMFSIHTDPYWGGAVSEPVICFRASKSPLLQVQVILPFVLTCQTQILFLVTDF